MLEGLVAWVLNSYLGQYVENLNTDQLSIGLLKGEVELEGLPLRKDAFVSLDLPVEVKAGFVGKVRLRIPFTRLRSEPWVISIEQLYLVAGLIPLSDYDEEKEDEMIQNRTLLKLDLMEAKWRSDHEARQEASYYASSYSSWMSYGTSLVSNILENIQLNVKDVHIRFEDDVTDRKSPAAFGVILESLTAQSCNDQWLPQFISGSAGSKYKLIEVQNLSMYWDVNATMAGNQNFSDLSESMRKVSAKFTTCSGSSSNDGCDPNHCYVVEPVSTQARLQRNSSSEPLRSRLHPRMTCDLLLDTLPISLNEEQYENMVVWIHQFDRLKRARPFRRWRPQVAVHGNVREWWVFAAKPHMLEHRRRHCGRNWTFVLERAKCNVLYVKAYTEHLVNPITCPTILKNHKDRMEQEVPFDELKLLREIAMERVLAVEEQTRIKKSGGGGGAGILQRWFPLWGGWYQQQTVEPPFDDNDQYSSEHPRIGGGQDFEEEILDVLNDIEGDGIFCRDAVFAKVNFTLKHGIVSLRFLSNAIDVDQANTNESKQKPYELEFDDMQIGMELRPRTVSSFFHICLGGLYLCDKSMDGSLFPTIIEPQIRDIVRPNLTKTNISASYLASRYLRFPWSMMTDVPMAKKLKQEPLFQLTYETKPFCSSADFRLHVKLRSLDIVYNESSIRRIVSFFLVPYQKTFFQNCPRQAELAAVAKNRYEKLKQQTKEEIRKNWDQILDGEQKFTQRWDVVLDISAPQIILPEKFFADDTTIVVCDLGRFQFSTDSATVRLEQMTPDSDEEDSFKTPCSTPPNESELSPSVSAVKSTAFQPTLSSIEEDLNQSDITEASLRCRMYDSYKLDISDLRILVYKAKSDWKYAYHKATSSMHVLDRFSVSLFLERRIIYTTDPQWPSITLSGSLPKLVVHLNEQKCQALSTWHNFLTSSIDSFMQSASPAESPSSVSNSIPHDLEAEDQDTNVKMGPSITASREMQAEARILLMQFSVGQLCLDLQSRGQSVAELQVTGIKSSFTMRPYDTSISLTVHGLLLVDALQTFGPDYELLVASHKNISMDSTSGSLRDSEPTSPTSPSSPTLSKNVQSTSFAAVNTALRNLHAYESSVPLTTNVTSTSPIPPSSFNTKDAEALITVELVMVQPQAPTDNPDNDEASNETIYVASVQFNNLDIIANQKTIVELLGFLRQVFPSSWTKRIPSESSRSKWNSIEDTAEEIAATPPTRIEVTFDFHRLSVLFMKSVHVGDAVVAQKVATATMSGTCIQATLADCGWKIQGSLGGLQLLDLVYEGAKHAHILSVGHDHTLDRQQSMLDALHSDVYRNISECSATASSIKEAFSFTVINQPKVHCSKPEEETRSSKDDDECISLTTRMASVRYIHSTRFLADLASCASEFTKYMADLANSFKSAAAEVAELCKEVDIKLDVLLETPVIVVPESPTSSSILVAHLGKITVSSNSRLADSENFYVPVDNISTLERISIEIRDINLFSQDFDDNVPFTSSIHHQWIPAVVTKLSNDYFCENKGFPILHKTVVVLTIDRARGNLKSPSVGPHPQFFFEEIKSQRQSTNRIQNFFNVCGRIISPLKVSLSKKQYEQILNTVNSVMSFSGGLVVGNSQVGEGGSETRVSNSSPKSRSTTVTGSESRTLQDDGSSSLNYSMKALFELPKLVIVLFGDLAEMERPLVSLSFLDFSVDFDKQHPYVSTATVMLKTLTMEDLLEDPGSKHRFLMLSSSPESNNGTSAIGPKARFLSSSCPDMTSSAHPIIVSLHSLPDKLNTENVFCNLHRLREKRMFGGCIHVREPSVQSLSDHCPCTPPPSPLGDGSEEPLDTKALVHVKVLFVDHRCPEFASRYNMTNRFVDVNFNCLDTVINLHSWVVVLDFFGIGNPPSSVVQPTFQAVDPSERLRHASFSGNRSLIESDGKEMTLRSTEMEIEVRSLTLVFNKEEYELAKANISNFVARVSQKKDHVSITGKLGSVSLLDLTPHGQLYRERFTTIGNEVLNFQIFKYFAAEEVEEEMSGIGRDYDAKIKLDMSSVRYIHTNRFSFELAAFFLHFNQLQGVMAQFRADAIGSEVHYGKMRSLRVKMDIYVGSPVIIIPVSSRSTRVLVADLGQLTLSNEFLDADTQGTVAKSRSVTRDSENGNSTQYHSVDSNIADVMTRAVYGTLDGHRHSKPCLLDVSRIDLVDMDFCLAERLDRHKVSNRTAMSSDADDLQFSSFVIRKKNGAFLTDKCKLKLQMERNLHTFDHSVPDVSLRGLLSTVHCLVDLEQYTVIRGILKYNLGEAIEDFKLPQVASNHDHSLQKGLTSNKSWLQLFLHLDLVNVIVEVHQNHIGAADRRAKPLAKVDFIKSKLTYEHYSNNSVDVDLVSQEILVSDTRFREYPANSRPNVFTNILQPTKGSESDLLQAEVHFRMSNESSRATVLLNNMQVIAIFDWWTLILDFILVDIDGTFEERVDEPSHPSSAAKMTCSLPNYTVSNGVATKRGPVTNAAESPFELKINITETSIVVVEDASIWDTSAIILKTTAVVSHCPNMRHKPLSCSLQRLEVFSCILGLEEDTALSIVDPVTVNLELVARNRRHSSSNSSNNDRGLLDSVEMHHTFDVTVHDLNVRLSYHDMQLFLRILDSLPKQASCFGAGGSSSAVEAQELNETVVDEHTRRIISQVSKLEALGFRQGDCLKALDACRRNLDDAALWLTLNATASVVPPPSNQSLKLFGLQWVIGGRGGEAEESEGGGARRKGGGALNMKTVEIHVNHICVCLIDDCRDADVPLLELTLSDLSLQQNVSVHSAGKSQFLLGVDFYNRNLSGWEPFIEPWHCSISWQLASSSSVSGGGLQMITANITGQDILNINITSTLIELYKNVKLNWTQDYYKLSCPRENDDDKDSSSVNAALYHHRSPFVPFALKNDTGCGLKFLTVTSTPDQLTMMDNYSGSNGRASRQSDQWSDVPSTATMPFLFESRLKTRHQNTHEFKVHQLIIRIDGWEEVAPVSVDKVGVFFRHAQPLSRTAMPARIVLAVTLEGSARKLVTVRSALTLGNQLNTDVEFRLENSMLSLGAVDTMYVKPNEVISVPLPFVTAQIYARPVQDPPLLYCTSAIPWQHVTRSTETHDATYWCTSTRPNVRQYRFCARVQRENYPTFEPQPPPLPVQQQQQRSRQMAHHHHHHQPGHSIVLIPPVSLVNLLPYDLDYRVQSQPDIRGRIRPDKQAAIHNVDLSETFQLVLLFDNFQVINDLVVPTGSTGFMAVLQARDVRNRTLLLQVRAVGQPSGSSIRIYISAPFWLVNKTGLPLIIRQEGVQGEAAGQFSEHEMARSVTPLLFSFTDREAPSLCSLRVGKSIHSDGEPQWCHNFHLSKGVHVRRLHVLFKNARPVGVYSIGIDVQVGGGDYSDVHIVTFSPRFQLDNHSLHKLEFTQKYALESSETTGVDSVLTAMPKCLLPFHWPKLDHEQLLCVRMSDVDGCHWSGGLFIERIDSFHVNMRDGQNKPVFLRVEIVLQNATYFVVFTDADNMPPPFRIDNMSEVPVTCFQSNADREYLKMCVRPHTSVPYAWDEPTLRPFITCMAPGGCSAPYNMATLGESKANLSYENFIYVALSETFRGTVKIGGRTPVDNYNNRELVLDVPPRSTRVVLARKEPGKRSQLWRMTSTGMLQHEGSSPPVRNFSMSDDYCLVLDIEDIAPRPKEYVRLMLRKPDKRRSVTQTWLFTEDGRLCCKLCSNLFVQPMDGFHGLRCDNDVVLGPHQPIQYQLTKSGIAVEQMVCRQRLWPGSGYLGVKITSDGPTRVMQIVDVKQKSLLMVSLSASSSQQSNWTIVEENLGASNFVTKEEDIATVGTSGGGGTDPLEGGRGSGGFLIRNSQFQIVTRLPHGLGISLINSVPEELVYARLVNIVVEVTKTSAEQKLDGTVQDIQVDNQLADAECPVLLFVSPSQNRNDHQCRLPAIHFSVHRVTTSRHVNVDIFKNLMVTVKNLTLQFEERLLWKLLQFVFFYLGSGADRSMTDWERQSAGTWETQRFMQATSIALAKRYYFSIFKLKLDQVRLSMITSSGLSTELRAIKRKTGLTLVRFEDALVELDPFVRTHPFETAQFLLDAIADHYKDELKGQAAKILGAVDFLGNPLGLVNDVSEGLTGFLSDGNVGGLLKNVTHGLSNSAAKVTGTLSEGLGVVTMDDKHREQRKRIHMEHAMGSGGDRLVAGLRGLSFGLYGGMTSLVKQTYEGASNEGIPGFFSGFGKGLVGTFTKPAVGMLDLATSAASAVRDTSRSSYHAVPPRIRPRRLCVGPSALLPKYSLEQSNGQHLLYSLNDKEYSELFIACEPLGYSRDALNALISTRKIYFLSQSSSSASVSTECVLTVPLSDLYHCKVVRDAAGMNAFYLELTTKAQGTTGIAVLNDNLYNRPKVVCATEAIAQKVAHQINYAKRMSDELTHTLTMTKDNADG